ncbi:MAG: cytochrome c3 family protein [Bacteroidales bacterium]
MINRLLTSAVFLVFLLQGTLRAETDTVSQASRKDSMIQVSHEDLKLGERLFKGLITTGSNTVNCASCHSTSYIDTLNWNPSAYDIATKFSRRDAKSLAAVLLQPGGKRMSEAHADIQLDEVQIGQLKVYLDELAKGDPPVRKPLMARLLLFILSVVIALLVTADLLVFHKIRFKLLHVIVLLGLGGWQVFVVSREAIAIGRSQNYVPLQPIKFSHKVHVEGNKIDCKYCHSTVEQSKAAGIPSAGVCMNCHMVVREGPRSGKFEINKIYSAIDSNRPIQWIKVHNLPDFVFFSHAQHVGAGKVECRECHGAVEKMDVVQQVSDLSMGFCIKCHREREVQFIDNAFYATWKEFHEKMKTGEIKRVTVEDVGGTDCMKCHY